MNDVVGLLLAAGGGRRMGGGGKALLRVGGRTLVERGVRALRDGGCGRVVVVLGARAAEVRRLGVLGGAVAVDNPAWESGMGSSLRTGIEAVAAAGGGAALVLLVDQPGVGAAAVARVRGAYRSPDALAAAGYGGRRGHPVLIGAGHFAGVRVAARGDRGARDYLRERAAVVRLVECGDIADPADLDTPGDLAAFGTPH
ncbi:NTP transferase domain-containing protein [Streptomyces harbinensis]|uniref:nucleotidyltransferase family protein n=1 Tax=Streptomyces harbinensis TaxID=1176198 RepID=UPI0033920509